MKYRNSFALIKSEKKSLRRGRERERERKREREGGRERERERPVFCSP